MSPAGPSPPTSGAGAAQHGGRLNRIGVPALYLALEELTALEECRQLSTLMPPGLIVSYTVALATVVDFSHGYTADWDSLWQEMGCDWRRILINDRVEPPSWLLADLALEAGASGILFPSLANPRGVNLVVYTDAFISRHTAPTSLRDLSYGNEKRRMQNHDDVLIVRGDADLRCYWLAMEGQPFADVEPAEFGIERQKAQVRFLTWD